MRSIYRWVVPIDGAWHAFQFHRTDQILHVGARFRGEVEFWTTNEPTTDGAPRAYRVFGTGDEIPNHGRPVGTGIFDNGSFTFVWHLVEGCPVDPETPDGCGELTCRWCSLMRYQR